MINVITHGIWLVSLGMIVVFFGVLIATIIGSFKKETTTKIDFEKMYYDISQDVFTADELESMILSHGGTLKDPPKPHFHLPLVDFCDKCLFIAPFLIWIFG
jgi:uncharacterized membrane protein